MSRFAAGAALATALAGAALAQEAASASLDKAIATPRRRIWSPCATDPSFSCNPSTIIFALYAGAKTSGVYAKSLGRLPQAHGKTDGQEGGVLPGPVERRPIEAMRSGRLHVAGFNTGSNPIAVNCAALRARRIWGRRDGAFGYEMEI